MSVRLLSSHDSVKPGSGERREFVLGELSPESEVVGESSVGPSPKRLWDGEQGSLLTWSSLELAIVLLEANT